MRITATGKGNTKSKLRAGLPIIRTRRTRRRRRRCCRPPPRSKKRRRWHGYHRRCSWPPLPEEASRPRLVPLAPSDRPCMCALLSSPSQSPESVPRLVLFGGELALSVTSGRPAAARADRSFLCLNKINLMLVSLFFSCPSFVICVQWIKFSM